MHPLHSVSVPTSAGFHDVPVATARPLLAGVRLVDVREPHEFSGDLGHVAGAELVPLGTIAEAAAGWDRRAPILLICRSGGRSGRAAAALAGAGFAELYNLSGGMLAWNDAGLPVSR